MTRATDARASSDVDHAETRVSAWRLAHAAPELNVILTRASVEPESTPRFAESEIRRETVQVIMRDRISLATDLYLPPTLPAPVIATRTPYGRANDRIASTLLGFARRGYVVISQDCRGTGGSEPDVWDYCVYEPEDGFDFVEWVSHQDWFDGFLYSFGASYGGATQWCMATHPRMSATAPEVTGLQTTRSTVRLHMFVNGYARVVGKGLNRLPVPPNEIERLIESETLTTGYFNEPLQTPLPKSLLDRYPHLAAQPLFEAKNWLWTHYCSLAPAQRVELLKQLMNVSEFSFVEMESLQTVFDCRTLYGFHTMPSVRSADLFERFRSPALILTGWYEWQLVDQLSDWALMRREARAEVASGSRLIITPCAHGMPGYHEGAQDHPELRHNHRYNIDLLMGWHAAVREGTVGSWPRVIYYLMGANEWRIASDWPVPEALEIALYLGSGGSLSREPSAVAPSPDRYTYDPEDPTPTAGGSILSYLYTPGSADVSEVQRRSDVLVYTTDPFERDLHVVGPLRLILYASSSAVDTDFAGRLSDVFPDGRAIQLQNGMLRARFRHPDREPELLEPGRIYCLEIDMWATANCFKAGHRLRLDISSADFPRFDRNSNRGGEPGPAVPALQAVYRDAEHPSHLLLSILP